MPEIFTGTLGVVLLIVSIFWAALMFFAPFFWFLTWHQTMEVNNEVTEIRKLLVKLAKVYVAETPILPVKDDKARPSKMP